MKTKLSSRLKLVNKGVVTLKSAKKVTNYILQEMSQGSDIECEHHASDKETVFAFMVNGMCCTIHMQEMEGGRA